MKLSNLFKSRARIRGEELSQTLGNIPTHEKLLSEEAVKAAANREVRLLQLVTDGAKLEIVDSSGFTPAMETAYKGLNKVLEAIIAAGGDLTAVSTERSMIPGLTPLMWAAYAGNANGVEALLAAKVDVNAKGRNDKTALHFAARTNPETVAILLKAKADVNAVSGDGRTPLFEAVLNPDNVKNVQLLLNAGATLDAKDAWSGWTILDAATKHGGPNNPVAKLIREAIAKRDAAVKPVVAPAPVEAPVTVPAAPVAKPVAAAPAAPKTA